MENGSKKKQKVKERDFTFEYNEIINSSEKSVVIRTQWEKDGDFFQKISLYDDTYVPVKTLGSTTLINSL
ncbi:MAG: hypothetical protein ACLGGV_06725 [Bacteroidia bacterium]